MTLKESVEIFVEEQIDYYNQWILDEPIFISERYNDDLGQLQYISIYLSFLASFTNLTFRDYFIRII